MTSTISELKCGDDTITLMHEHGNLYTLKHEAYEPDLPEGHFTIVEIPFGALDQAAVAFTQRVVSLMTVYAEAPCAAAEEAFKQKVFA